MTGFWIGLAGLALLIVCVDWRLYALFKDLERRLDHMDKELFHLEQRG